MSPRSKQQLYHSLAQLLRAGIPFPKALEKLNTTARGAMLAKTVYPIFILVLGVLLLNLPKIINESTAAYLRTTLGLLGAVAAGIWVLFIFCRVISGMATFSPLADGFVRLIPLV